jgi:hypothetical protein
MIELKSRCLKFCIITFKKWQIIGAWQLLSFEGCLPSPKGLGFWTCARRPLFVGRPRRKETLRPMRQIWLISCGPKELHTCGSWAWWSTGTVGGWSAGSSKMKPKSSNVVLMVSKLCWPSLSNLWTYITYYQNPLHDTHSNRETNGEKRPKFRSCDNHIDLPS